MSPGAYYVKPFLGDKGGGILTNIQSNKEQLRLFQYIFFSTLAQHRSPDLVKTQTIKMQSWPISPLFISRLYLSIERT